MDLKQNLKPADATVMSTAEFLAYERKTVVASLVMKLIERGKASRRSGWVMSGILKEVEVQLGKAALPYARRYIIQDVCGIK